MIDLHSHTTASDGTDSPGELIARAAGLGLEALAITDHDTLQGYDEALPAAQTAGLDLVCGIELSTKFHAKTVHLLGYFPAGRPRGAFAEWLTEQGRKRRERNIRLIGSLNAQGVEITLEEVESIGRTMTGRPHFAQILVRKGYVKTLQEAFDRYIAEEGVAFVQREEVPLPEAIERVAAAADGVTVLAHPIRLGKRNHADEEALVAEAVAAGLTGIEVIHSDHSPADVERYRGYAGKFGLLETGGSDFHGANKPDIELGTGRRGNVNVPRDLLDRLRAGR